MLRLVIKYQFMNNLLVRWLLQIVQRMSLGSRPTDLFLPRQGHAANVPESILLRSTPTASRSSMF
jgi:hypothetical protein